MAEDEYRNNLLLPNILEKAIKQKETIRQKLESLLDPKEKKRAKKDHHSRRKPRHCGMTIHTGIGCKYGCIYCYIWDMGFPGRPEPYPLSPLEVTYALSLNPYIVPGHTFAAYGSVTEPFQDETLEYAVSLISEVYKWLKLPSQVSTKSVLTRELVSKLKRGDPRLSILITAIASEENSRRLEPNAPSVKDRILSARNLQSTEMTASMFIRPIIPGVTENDIHELLQMARDAGINSVVFGTLRVTEGIVRRLEMAGYRIPENMLPRHLEKRRQKYISSQHIKQSLIKIAKQYGFHILPSACAANIFSHKESCAKCKLGPCNNAPRKPSFQEVKEALEILGLEKCVTLSAVENLRIHLRRRKRIDRRCEVGLFWLQEITKLNVILS